MRLTAIPRMTIGLVSLGVFLLLGLDLLLGLFPNEAHTHREARQRAALSLAQQVVVLVQARDWRNAERTLRVVQQHDAELASIGLRRADGSLLAQAGGHPDQPDGAADGMRALNVPLQAAGHPWGALELRWRDAGWSGWAATLLGGPTRMVAVFALAATALFYLYLRRMMAHLDPSAAVPDRVRNAFDTLIEGVLVVDTRGRILLTNKAFQALRPPEDTRALVGLGAAQLGWLQPADGGVDAAPWLAAMQQREALRGLAFEVRDTAADADADAGAVRAHVVLNCTPLSDERGALRGCMVSIGDMTALELSHRQLLEVLADLATSKQQLELQNDELVRLANTDALSGCLNRRALFAAGDGLLAASCREGRPLVCVMADIDHFKKINDTWGHAVGDQAIRRFADLLRQQVRADDLLGRYGGEEFCIVLVGVDLARARVLAEAIRASVAANQGQGLDPGPQLAMSASFGVALATADTPDLAAVIDRADRAMYLAKQGGRNRVVVYQPEHAEA